MKSSSIPRARTLLLVMLSLLIAGSTSYGVFDIARLVTITNPAPAAADLFGNSMAGLGTDKVVIGAYLDDASGPDAGSAYLYNVGGARICTVTNPLSVDSQFFGSVVANLGTDRFLVSSWDDTFNNTNAGSVYLYNTNGTLLATVTNPAPPFGDRFGCSVAGVGNDRIVVGAAREDTGASDAGVAYVFNTNGILLLTVTNPTPVTFEQFGYTVAALGSDRFMVGCYRDNVATYEVGAVYLYNISGAFLTNIVNPTPSNGDFFGIAMTAVGNDRIVIGAPGKDAGDLNVGCAYIYNTNGTLLVTVTNPTPEFGDSFGQYISAVGSDKFLVGVSSDRMTDDSVGSAYLYDLNGNLLLSFINPTPDSYDYFGVGVAGVGSSQVVIGASGDDVGASGAGIAYSYALSTNLLRYGFEDNKQGWLKSSDSGSLAITNVMQTASWAYASSHSLLLDCELTNTPAAYQKGEAMVDMEYFPPDPRVIYPLNMDGKVVNMRVYCPAGASGTNSQAWAHHRLMLFVKDESGKSLYDTGHGIPSGSSVMSLSMAVSTNQPLPWGYIDPGFDPTKIRYVGVKLEMKVEGGPYKGPMYLDQVAFAAAESPDLTTNTQHRYDFETASQQEWWKWGADPESWNAYAWSNTYYATNQGVAGSVALAADAVFVTNSTDALRKGVFEIAYQPALNLSTKDYRRIQAKLKFVPPIEGLLSFDASINVFDKVTDQWYKKDFKIGGSGWNILDFDLDNTNEYTGGSPVPMNTTAIGFVTIQFYANMSWTGTVYLDNVVVGGRETGTNFTKLTGAFVQPAGHKFVVGGTNFYFCGANIEYLQTVPDATVTEALDWATNTHLQIVRTWAMQEGKPYSFQPQRGVWNELMFEHLDRIVAEAGNRKIRLMLALCDNWAHNGGIFQYVAWAVKEHPESVDTNLNKEGVLYHDQFWTNTWCKQWYTNYVTRLLNRTNTVTGAIYKSDPTIFAWEIVNEPRCESDFSGRTIHNWLNEMSGFVRTIDTNHMLGNGEEGGYVNTYDFADTIPWEDYPNNYYHYGTYATGSSECDLYGCGRGHGVDFLSDNMSQSREVTWQGGFYTNRDAPQSEWRSGNSNINFCTARIYVDQKEYNVWRTNLNSADQKFEWINDHWYDAHTAISKPMILEEFGIHAIGWIFNGSYGQVQLVRTPEYTFQDRVNIYSQYYSHIERSGISGSFFWNFGYQGMWDDPFHLCEQVAPWYAETSDGSAKTVTLSSAYTVQGSNSLKLSWNVPDQDHNKAIFRCPTNEQWVLRVDNTSTNEPPTHGINRTKFFWNIYNPSTTNITVALAIRGGPAWFWCETPQVPLTQGWTRIMFDLSAGTWAWSGNAWLNSEYLINIPNSISNVLEDVHEVDLAFYHLTNGTGDAYIDNIQIKRDDGFVVYADDQVVPVIKAHADWMTARNVATNLANNVPVASNKTIVADAFRATNVTLTAGDSNGDILSFRLITKPTNGWVFGTPPTLVYKSKPGTVGGDLFSFKVNDGKADSAEGVITVNLGSTDTDNDSLSDAWEFIYFPKRVQYWPYDSDSLTNMLFSGDWDLDGFTDYDEYRAGTSPTNSASYLWVGALSNSPTQFFIRWPGVSGRQYELQKSTNLIQADSGFTGLASNIWAVEPMNTWTDSVSGSGPHLYRVRVQ